MDRKLYLIFSAKTPLHKRQIKLIPLLVELLIYALISILNREGLSRWGMYVYINGTGLRLQYDKTSKGNSVQEDNNNIVDHRL